MAQDEKYELEIKKLRWEISTLESNAHWERRVGRAVSLLGPLLVCLGLVVGGCQYRDAKEMEFKQVFWERQMAVYDEITRSAARLVAPGDTVGHDSVYQRFATLYNGPLLLVADTATAMHALAFYRHYIDYRLDPGTQIEAQAAARALAASFREVLRNTWDVPLKALDAATLRKLDPAGS